VRDFVEVAFDVVQLPSRKYVKHDSAFDRPIEPACLVGSPAKIKSTLKWAPEVSFERLVYEMVQAELQIAAGATNERSTTCC
jgi:GDPmannose 4,6-dehydratase